MGKGLVPKTFGRKAGVLLPVSSLPSAYGIGTLGKEAIEFIDALEKAGQSYWQVLPVGPTSYGDSPYQSFSAFAGNPYFIDLEELIEEGLLTKQEVDAADFGDTPEYVQYDKVFKERFSLLKKAYGNSKHQDTKEYQEFEKTESFWLEDYALFMALKFHFEQVSWLDWEDDIRLRKDSAIKKYEKELADEIGFWKFTQFRFYQAWNKVKAYAGEKNVQIIGDIPIYVALDSADVWANPELFQLDKDRKPVNVAGCPPDAFSADGQKWGNPLYDWEKMEKDDFAWWKKRMTASAKLYDVIRIDHFIGMVRYYNIPADKSAKEGWYTKGPGIKLVHAIESVIGGSKIIAEDLGVVVPEVEELLRVSGYPGMKVLEFAFDSGNSNVYLPHNHKSNYVLYIGTHDNDTIRGYYRDLCEKGKEYLKTYLNLKEDDEVVDGLIRCAYESVCDTVILQMQDVLNKDGSARMNLPSTMGMNWKWRLIKGEFTHQLQRKLYRLSDIYGRLDEKYIEKRRKSMSKLSAVCDKRYGKEIKDLTNEEIYYALLEMTKDAAKDKESADGKKKIYYISAEFLIGKLLSNNLINLGLFEEVKKELADAGKDLYEIEEVEPEPSLGNGGLGRLAACFLDSMATLGLNGDGIGINYHLGLFKQVFENNLQKETSNPWIEKESWLTPTDVTYDIEFGSCKVKSKLYNIAVTGYENRTNQLHLFDIDSVDEGIVSADGTSFDKTNIEKNLTLFLYPDDSDENGLLLRIYQQYFMVSSGARLILDECKKKGSNLHDLYDYAVIQINDTHPSMVIPELIRLLTAEGISMDEAIEIVSKTCAYTNHTILAEALEKWPMHFLEKVVPQLVPIIRELDRRVREKFSDKSVYIIDDTNRVHMAHMDIHYGISVNGVAYLHTEILKDSELNNFYKIYPEKFNNKTNGITFRRWLLHCNEELTAYIQSLIGDGFKKDAKELEKLEKFVNDDAVLDKILEIKKEKKLTLKKFLKDTQNIDVNEDSIFDIQVKRLHEYKRQQMNALYVIHKYFDIKAGNKPKTPLTVIFGAKAAPAYTIAKDIIHLIICLQELIKNDPEVAPYLNVVMVENYNVSKAAKIIPACDISEQISLASKEASGTGNMKFMLNGAVTLGTEDGANVEIAELVGNDNIYIFGEKSQTVIDHYAKADYVSRNYYEQDPEIRRMVDFIVSPEVMKLGNRENLERLHHELISKDWFMTLLDIKDYIKVKETALNDYSDRKNWAKKMLVNIAKAGFFSSDRTIEQYNEDIWKLN